MTTLDEELPSWIRAEVSLAPLTTLELGGCARYFADAHRVEEIVRALAWANSQKLSVLVLGGGSNMLVSDDGVDALVLRVANRGVKVLSETDSTVLVRVAAGERWDDFVRHCVEQRWLGVECLSGIPGTVGATPVQNVGAYGQEVSERIHSVTVIDRVTGMQREVSAQECEFAYRDSAFKRTGHALSNVVIVEVVFALAKGAMPTVRYAELREAIARKSAEGATQISPQLVREMVLELRRSKSMVIESGDENRRSVGSFFTNPIVSTEILQEIVRRALERQVVAEENEVPRWAVAQGEIAEGRVKLSAAWLIERAGWKKGTRSGNVGVSSRHSLALIHHGGGSTRELLAFAESIRASVREQWGVGLEYEPVRVG